METSNIHQTRVGIFITIGIILISVSLFFLGGSRVFKKEYRLKVQLSQIQGLAEGSLVSLAGINIGNIESIDFVSSNILPSDDLPSKNNKIELTLRLQASFQKQITKESTIEIRNQGALGDKYLYIEPGKIGGESLTQDSLIPTVPDNDILTMLSKNGDRAKTAFDVIEDIHKITLSLTNDNKISKILSALDTSSTQLNLTLKEGQKLLLDARGIESDSKSKLANSIMKIDKILTKIDRGEGSLGALINDPTLHDQLKSLLGANRRSQSIKNLMRLSIEKKADEDEK
jgi:phospholipid/cholesterol/gamma-HCH transport system substrate-binding protein